MTSARQKLPRNSSRASFLNPGSSQRNLAKRRFVIPNREYTGRGGIKRERERNSGKKGGRERGKETALDTRPNYNMRRLAAFLPMDLKLATTSHRYAT
ncbi:hypothetical protein PUN28_003151 [Cardiocondyla obscurior]|uniref:Uncharacterized protein n=1 Tax=Cardiocondyla obscurior TaxID=286306 RepID=A0AAW2GK97_9HYME